MNGLILKLEELNLKTKGIADLIGALFYAGESGTPLNDFSDGLNLLFSIAVDNSRKLDEVWQEMHMLNKNKKTSKSGDVA